VPMDAKRLLTFAICMVGFSLVCAAQHQSLCPPGTVINSGICRDQDGNDCSSRESQPLVWYQVELQYTEQAAEANVEGTVVLSGTVGTDGCLHEIKVVRSLGYGLDETAIAALLRFRFRRVVKPLPIRFEFNLNAKYASKHTRTNRNCPEGRNA